MRKTFLQAHYKRSMQKTAPTNTLSEKLDYFENWKNGHNAKAIAFAKCSVWVKGYCYVDLFDFLGLCLCFSFAENANNSEVNSYP